MGRRKCVISGTDDFATAGQTEPKRWEGMGRERKVMEGKGREGKGRGGRGREGRKRRGREV